MTPFVLAAATDDIGPGATAFFIVVALIIAALAIFWALFGSLRRLKKSVADGVFGTPPREPADGQHEALTSGPASDAPGPSDK